MVEPIQQRLEQRKTMIYSKTQQRLTSTDLILP